ncbi:putative ribonuclease H-like domain-containing protein [Tanacetum coccineum]
MYCLVVTDDYSRFSWVFFLVTKDETCEILKTFITGIENLIDLKVKVIRCDNRTEFKNKVMNQFYEINDALTISMNYKPVVAGNQTNGNAGTKENIDAGQAGKKIVHDQEYILLPLLTSDPSLSKSSKDSPDAGFKPSGEEEKIDSEHPENEDSEVPNTEEPRVNQEQDANVNSTNNINTVCPTINAADIENNVVDENIVYGCIDDPNMPNLEEIVYSDDDEEVGAEADMNNLATTMPVSPIPTTRVHKDHPLKQIIGDIHSAPQTRRMTKNVTEHVEPKKVIQALTDPSWIEAMQDELLQFKLQKVWTLVDLPYGKRAIGTKWVYRNKKDDRGIVVRNKARLVAQGYTQEEGIDYDEVFALVARIEAIRLFLAYASFMNFIVYQMDVKSAFLYGTIEEEVYVCQPPGFKDPEFPNKVYKVEKALYGLHQAPRAWTKVKQKNDGVFISQDKYVADILKNFYFSSVKTASTPMEPNKPLKKDEEAEDVDVTPKVSHLYAVKRIFRYLKGQPKLGLWYPKDSPFELEAFSDSDYARANLDKKSTTGGCQFLGRRLISWQCKKQTIIALSTTEAEYVAAANCCGQHNMVAFLQKPTGSEEFQQILDFLTGSHIRYALTENPTIYVSLIEQFWQTVTVKTVNDGEQQLTVTVDGQTIAITEASVRRHL